MFRLAMKNGFSMWANEDELVISKYFYNGTKWEGSFTDEVFSICLNDITLKALVVQLIDVEEMAKRGPVEPLIDWLLESGHQMAEVLL